MLVFPVTLRPARSTYKEIEPKLVSCLPFIGSSLQAVGSTREASGYRVYSYTTLIATVTRDTVSGRLVRSLDPKRYSSSTSRAQKLCRRCLPGIDGASLQPTLKEF